MPCAEHGNGERTAVLRLSELHKEETHIQKQGNAVHCIFSAVVGYIPAILGGSGAWATSERGCNLSCSTLQPTFIATCDVIVGPDHLEMGPEQCCYWRAQSSINQAM